MATIQVSIAPWLKQWAAYPPRSEWVIKRRCLSGLDGDLISALRQLPEIGDLRDGLACAANEVSESNSGRDVDVTTWWAKLRPASP